MREIKFRYFNTTTNEMVNDPPLPFKEGWTVNQLFEDRGWIWQQYTGLKDKNGVEIYEGDIVVVPDKYIWFIPTSDEVDLNDPSSMKNAEMIPNYRGVVEWVYSSWSVSAVSVNPKNRGGACGEGLNDDGFDEGAKSDWLVLGNIYQHPNLLENK